MSRDYKHRATPRRRKRQPRPGWLWLLAGLAIGLFVAFLIYLQQRQESPEAAQPAPAPKGQTLNVPQTAREARDVRKTAPSPLPPPPKPRFDFYTILPEAEVVVPEQEITGKPREGVRQVEAPGTYLLQAGSFRTLQQADQLKARLALLGLQASIQTVTINNRETWHRVRVGPFDDLDTLNTARVRLKENQLDAILLKIKG